MAAMKVAVTVIVICHDIVEIDNRVHGLKVEPAPAAVGIGHGGDGAGEQLR
jgi:hypothetical protein